MSSLYQLDSKTGTLVFRDGIKPNVKQDQLFKLKAKHIGYGGARGGGKSWALRVKFALLAIRFFDLRILLLRRTYPELESNHIIPLQRELKGIARYKETKKMFVFIKTESIIKLGYCKNEKDVIQFQGQEYDVIGFEEATLFSESQIRFIRTCLRSTRADFISRIYYTCNPGGESHHFIKRLFIDRDFEKDENPADYVFIQALIYDNEILMKNDPEYINLLNSMDEDMIAAHRDGDWDALSGAFFKEFKRNTHVIETFVIPEEWNKYVVIDYGLDMLAAYWIADNLRGNFYVYKEIYEPNLIISEAAKRLKEVNGTDIIIYWYAPPDLKFRNKDTGKSALELFFENGIPFITTTNDRVEGWLMVKELLKVREVKQLDGSIKKQPSLYVFENCTNLKKYFPVIQRSDKNPNDVAKEPHIMTHALDAIRYFSSEYVKLPTTSKIYITGVWHRNELRAEGYNNAQIDELFKKGYIQLIGE